MDDNVRSLAIQDLMNSGGYLHEFYDPISLELLELPVLANDDRFYNFDTLNALAEKKQVSPFNESIQLDAEYCIPLLRMATIMADYKKYIINVLLACTSQKSLKDYFLYLVGIGKMDKQGYLTALHDPVLHTVLQNPIFTNDYEIYSQASFQKLMNKPSPMYSDIILDEAKSRPCLAMARVVEEYKQVVIDDLLAEVLNNIQTEQERHSLFKAKKLSQQSNRHCRRCCL